ncbi:hypothetical protein YC2023_057500 [Brassica napus]
MSDTLRMLREVKLLRLLRHLDIVEIKSIMLPPPKREFRDIYIVSDLMESDLHQLMCIIVILSQRIYWQMRTAS